MPRFERTSMASGQTSLRTIALSAIVLSALGFSALSAGCSATGVGDPCTPEAVPTCGFASTEVYVETSSVQCRTRVCVVYRLDGNPENLQSDGCPLERHATCDTAMDNSTCVDDTIAAVAGTTYALNSLDRVFCSCRCRALETNPDLPICECGDGYHCSDEDVCVPHEADDNFCTAEYTTNCEASICDLTTQRCFR